MTLYYGALYYGALKPLACLPNLKVPTPPKAALCPKESYSVTCVEWRSPTSTTGRPSGPRQPRMPSGTLWFWHRCPPAPAQPRSLATMRAGEFQVVNQHLLRDLTDLDIWSEKLKNDHLGQRKPKFGKMSSIHIYGWKLGLKTDKARCPGYPVHRGKV